MRDIENTTCPVCNVGIIKNHKCNYCKTEFCGKCHNVMKTYIGLPKNVMPCICGIIKKK